MIADIFFRDYFEIGDHKTYCPNGDTFKSRKGHWIMSLGQYA